MKDITIKGLVFSEFITKDELNTIVRDLANKIETKFVGKNPLFLVMLNGAFVFASDFLRSLGKPYETIFLRYSSYSGLKTTGEVITSVIPDDVNGRDVVVLEDIVDSGLTMDVFKKELKTKSPNSITIVSLLSKPSARKIDVDIDYVGMEIEDKFVVGYGLDYDGIGRNIPSIFVLKNN